MAKTSKKKQEKLLTEIMEADQRDGLYGETLKDAEIIQPKTFSVQFSFQEKSAKITLTNGEDLIKIAELMSGFLTANGIKNILEKK